MNESKTLAVSKPQKLSAIQALTPRNIEEATKLAEMLCKSSIVPKEMQGNPGNVLVAIGMGQEVGLGPLQAIQNIMVVNGRPSMWGDAVLGLVRASGLLESFNETLDEKNGQATCQVVRKGEKNEIVRTFSMLDAKRAGLDTKPGPWQGYPKRMLQMRARAWALRDAFPDVLKGLGIREEVDDYQADLPPPLPAEPSRIQPEGSMLLDLAEIMIRQIVDKNDPANITYKIYTPENVCLTTKDAKLMELIVTVRDAKGKANVSFRPLGPGHCEIIEFVPVKPSETKK